MASCAPVEAPEGTAARPIEPSSSTTSTSTVGLPRLSRISRPVISMMAVMRTSCSSFQYDAATRARVLTHSFALTRAACVTVVERLSRGCLLQVGSKRHERSTRGQDLYGRLPLRKGPLRGRDRTHPSTRLQLLHLPETRRPVDLCRALGVQAPVRRGQSHGLPVQQAENSSPVLLDVRRCFVCARLER